MALNLTQALAELASLTQSGSATSAALLNLVHQVSVDAEGAVTVLYSGTMGDGASPETSTKASQVVQDMLNSGKDIRVIDESAAASFLKSQIKGARVALF